MNPRLRNGMLCAIGAHVLWGLFPVFWRLLDRVPAGELVCHRILWALVFLLLFVGGRTFLSDVETRSKFLALLRRKQTWVVHAVSGVLIALNWLAFLWAVHSDRVLEASLGYYISPLFNVVLGVVFLGERLTQSQWWAILIATGGVIIMTIAGGGLPWVSIVMASSFAFYGLVKKRVHFDPLSGLMVEMMTLAIPTAILLGLLHLRGAGSFGNVSWQINGLLMLGGFLTVIPLALFAAAAQRAPLVLIGILQYIGPTIQFFVGAVWFQEAFDSLRLAGFVLVWIGSAVFLLSAIVKARRRLRASVV